MKVVITTDCFLPRWDGIARFLAELLPVLARDAKVTVFAPRFPGNVPQYPGVKIERFPLVKWKFGDIFFCAPDKKLMAEEIKTADVVFNQTIGPVGAAGIRIARKLKKPVVSYVHSIEWELAANAIRSGKTLIKFLVRWWARRQYNRCSLLLIPSRELDDLLCNNRVYTKKELVELGINTSYFVPPKSKAKAKEALGLQGKLVVGFAGRIAREKDLPTLYAAFDEVKVKNKKLVIVGEGLENEDPDIKQVRRVGAQNNVVPFLQAMDVFALPSLTETSSLATMEAMSTGIPVVATPVGNLVRYVVDGKNGFLFARGDVVSLAEKIEFLLTNPKVRTTMGKDARKTIVQGYDFKKSLAKIVKILKREG